MNAIKRLPDEVSSQIAAGEVVERPASIIKELVENSLDAKATRVDITIKNGGLDLIEIRDNGTGIAAEDLPLSVERFATSKLSNINDLMQLHTYGFRGEALASISAVSNLVISSKVANAEIGSQLEVTYGKVGKVEPVSRSQGTTISITNLFEQIPARLKFIKSPETEFKYILESVQSFALVHPEIAITLTNNGKSVYNLPLISEVSSIITKERVVAVQKASEEELVTVNHSEYGISIQGFVVHPKYLSNTSRYLKLFVNERFVLDKALSYAVQRGLEGYIPHGYKAAGVLQVTVAADQVDVNVHPRKTEVKFINPFRVYSAVSHAVKSGVAAVVASNMHIPQGVFKAPEFGSKESNYSSYSDTQYSQSSGDSNAYNRLRGGSSPQREYASDFSQQSMPQFVSDTIDSYNAELSTESHPKKDTSDLLTVYPVLKRYLVAEWTEELWIIDQHAAAERIRFEAFKKAYLDGKQLTKQALLIPIDMHISETENITIKNHIDDLQKLGIECEVTDTKLQISAIPAFLQNGDIERIVRDAISQFSELNDMSMGVSISDFSSTHDISLVIATMACHNSIRMNQRLSPEEAKSLVVDLLACDIPYACPHGRRICWILGTEQIDKEFMRT